jgi:N-acetylneuraminic acid mutarotase
MKAWVFISVILVIGLAACGAPAATEVAVAPTATPVPGTDTPLPPTDTPVSPTATEPPPATATPGPLTERLDTEPQTPAGWVRKADMAGASRVGFAAAVMDGKIYVMGGFGGPTVVQVYDPATDTWKQQARLRHSTAFASASVVDGRIYIIGGGSPVSVGDSYTFVEEYDPATDTWTEKASMQTPKDSLVTAVVDGKIYTIGGFDCTATGPCPVIVTVEMYDPATDTWTPRAPMPGARAMAAAGIVDGMIYVIGGQTRLSGDGTSSVYAYDPGTDTWAEKSPMPAERTWASGSVYDGQIYVHGGCETWRMLPSSNLFVYDPVSDTWAQRQDMPFQRWASWAGMVNGKIYLIGGSENKWPLRPYLTEVWEYDPAGAQAAQRSHTALLDAYIEAARAGDVDAALALFSDDAAVGDSVGKEEIRKIIEWDIADVAAGNDYVGYSNVVETADTLEFDLRFHSPDGDMEVHEIVTFENDKITSWTIVGPFKPVE